MNGRKASALLVALAIAVLALLAVLWPRGAGGPREPQGQLPGAQDGARALANTPGAARQADPSDPGPRPESAAQQGGLELHVAQAGKAVAGALVRLYARGPVDLSTATIDWRIAAEGNTGTDGTLRLAAPPGGYLVAARAQGFAKALREVTRPQGELFTKVELELAPGVSLRGRTVGKGPAGEPVPLCQITLTSLLRTPPEEQLRGQSDERGRFRFDGLARGRYRLEAKAAGFGSGRVDELWLPRDSELLVLLHAASFIEGRVVDAAGRPAAGAEVSSVGAADESAQTSQTGSFSLEVSPRSHRLQARRGEEAGAAEAPIAVAAGATARGVQIVLGKGGSISGVAAAAKSGQPLAGILVAISPHNENGDSGRSVSDAAGLFSIAGLSPGSYDVDAKGAGWAPEERRGLVVAAGARFELRLEFHPTGGVQGVVRDGAGRAIAGALVRGGQDRDNAQAEARTDRGGAYQLLGLPPGRTQVQARREGSLAGEVALLDVPESGLAAHDFTLADEGTLTGTLTRASGAPLKKPLSLRLFPAGGRRGTLSPEEAALPVDGAGAFSARLPQGAYTLFGPPGFSPTLVTIEAGQTTVKDLILGETDQVPPGLSGQVLEPDGTPSPLAQLRLYAAPQGRLFQILSADESGQFQVERQRADLPDSILLQAQSGARLGEVTVGPGETRAVVQLKQGGLLRGRVQGGGPAVEGLSVSYESFGRGRQTLEFAGDRYELREVPAGEILVSVQTRDGRTGEGSATVVAGQATQLDLALVQSATLVGRLVDAQTQAPVAGAYASLDGANAVGTESGPDGRFTLSGLQPGEHDLNAFAQPYDTLSRHPVLQPGQTLDLGDLPLTRQKPQPGTIGVSLRGDSAQVSVMFVQPGSPAEQAGIQPGDAVSAVDGLPVQGVDDARVRIRGAPGTQVLLTLSRNGTQRVLQVVRAS